MLPDNGQWRWIEGDDGALFLHMRYVCVGTVRPSGGAWRALVRNYGRERVKDVASREEGRAAVEDYWARNRWWRTVPKGR